MMRKFIYLLLACILLVSLCACGKSDDRDNDRDRKKKHKHTTEYTTDYNDDNSTNSVTDETHPNSSAINDIYGGYGELYVTDENGDRVLGEDGCALVYATDADGNIVTNADGVPESHNKPFVPISEADGVEYYGYSIVLPKGWTVTANSNRFENTSAGHRVTITPQNELYDSYYQAQREMYDLLVSEFPDDVSWTEDVNIGADCVNVVRFTLRDEAGMKVMYFFENSGNLYKIWFESTSPDTILNDSVAFCKAISYKPYQYFPENN